MSHVLTTSPYPLIQSPWSPSHLFATLQASIINDDPSPSPVSMLPLLIFLSSTLNFARAVTVYGQTALGFVTNAPAATPAAFNNTRLLPPAIPNPAPANAFSLILQQDAAVVGGLSIPHVGGCLWGFSIEMSVISQVRKSKFFLFFSSIFDHLFVLVGKNSYVQVDLLQ